MTRLARWWMEPVPSGRVAVFRVLVYLYVPLDVFLFTPWVAQHGGLPTALYQPLTIGRLLHLPTPTHTVVEVVRWLLVATALVAASGRAPRLSGTVVFALYLEWMVVAMSYGKVEHDRFAFLVALAVLPTVGATRFGDRSRSASAGWALRMVQVAVVLTYFLAAWAKIRFGGWDWPTGATLARAIVRRGTVLSTWMLDYPTLLVAGQFLMIGAELCSPLLLLARSDRARCAAVGLLLGFHVSVFAGITIIFLPHVVAIMSLLPSERLRLPGRAERSVQPARDARRDALA
ncbi:MAG TPA: hypothetical protein VIS06_08255 [Mycobacteriales bacterium]